MDKRQYPALDAMRGIAAILVCLEHLRLVMFGTQSAPAHNLPLKLFWFVADLGHQAVMVFFVLSGFLIGKSLITAFEAEQFSWAAYAFRRWSRLTIVLLPALVLTTIFDLIIKSYGPAALGALANPNVAVQAAYATGIARDSVLAFFGNLTFLQTIFVPTFGFDGPLWSLSNEFWYYVMFPLALLAASVKGWAGRIFYGGALLALLKILPFEISLYMLIWCLGAGIFAAERRVPILSCKPGLPILAVVTAIFAGLWVSARRPDDFLTDLTLAVAVAVLVFLCLYIDRVPKILAAACRLIAGFSYTLYLTHVPFLVLFWIVFRHGQILKPSSPALVLFAGLFALTVLFAYGVYWLFERNTSAIQTAIVKKSAALLFLKKSLPQT